MRREKRRSEQSRRMLRRFVIWFWGGMGRGGNQIKTLTSPKSRLALARATSGSQSSELTKGTAMAVGREREGGRELLVGGGRTMERKKSTEVCGANEKIEKKKNSTSTP